MNARALGSICILGGLAYAISGVRLSVSSGGSPGILDPINAALALLWVLGGISGTLGMLSLRATGDSGLARTLTALPIVTFTITGVCSALAATTGSAPMPWVAIGLVGNMLGMALVGVLALLARRLEGWRRVAPFGHLVAFVIAFLAGPAAGVNVQMALVAGLAYVAIGYAVQSSQRAVEPAISQISGELAA